MNASVNRVMVAYNFLIIESLFHEIYPPIVHFHRKCEKRSTIRIPMYRIGRVFISSSRRIFRRI
jgi:hypothetical protein